MKWRLWLVVLLFAASCAAPERPEAWSVQRVTPPDETEEESTGICDDVRALALGSHADETTLDGTLTELARLAALTGAAAALPLLSEIGDLSADSLSPHQLSVQRHDLLVLASRSIDDSTAAACAIPAFSALYAASGFPDCHFEAEIPVAAYTASGEPGCSAQGRPDFLPCWSDDGNHLATDCVTDEIVQAVDGRWEPAGEPRTIVIDRTDPDEIPGPDLVRANPSPECASLTSLFTVAPLPSSGTGDFGALAVAAADLSPDIRDQIDSFTAATTNPPTFDEFETLVSALDEATAAACGFPLVSAWASVTATLDTLPCWLPTGVPYPAYEIVDCT